MQNTHKTHTKLRSVKPFDLWCHQINATTNAANITPHPAHHQQSWAKSSSVTLATHQSPPRNPPIHRETHHCFPPIHRIVHRHASQRHHHGEIKLVIQREREREREREGMREAWQWRETKRGDDRAIIGYCSKRERGLNGLKYIKSFYEMVL